MKTPAQIEQRISHLKEREKKLVRNNGLDIKPEIAVLEWSLAMEVFDIWKRFKEIVKEDLYEEATKSDLREIRILLWILED